MILSKLENQSQTMIVDSVPVPVVKMAREKSFKAFRKSYETAPAKGWALLTKVGSSVTSCNF